MPSHKAVMLTALPLDTASDVAVDACRAPRVVVPFTCTDTPASKTVSLLALWGSAL